MSDRRVLTVSAENGALPGGKVGGIGDVVRDVPLALARNGWAVDVVTPSHGFLHKSPGAYWLGTVPFAFGGQSTNADVYAIHERRSDAVTHYVIDHPALVTLDGGRFQIYSNGSSDSPFALDAGKYALFCAAACECVLQELIKRPACVHLHDWHAAFVLILRKYDPSFAALQNLRTVYSIHNLALQGIRPFKGAPSSMESWFPQIAPAPDLADPRWPDCVNPMAVGIRLADAVHTVSPSYATEILRPSDPPRAYGGEGLESELADADDQGRLFGILNGCDYRDDRVAPRRQLAILVDELRGEVLNWIAEEGVVSAAHAIALERLRTLAPSRDPAPLILTSVSRIADQKIFLLRATGTDGVSGLESILNAIQDLGVYFFLGTGDKEYQDYLVAASARYPNFVFLNGFSEACANALYASGDLFVMPSSFEPCGIGQMLAMRDGQPCLVHGVGGLKDTVSHKVNGFVFQGETVQQQINALRETCEQAVILWTSHTDRWEAMRISAAAARFLWDDTVDAYVSQLYECSPTSQSAVSSARGRR
jgi:starch synthase